MAKHPQGVREVRQVYAAYGECSTCGLVHIDRNYLEMLLRLMGGD